MEREGNCIRMKFITWESVNRQRVHQSIQNKKNAVDSGQYNNIQLNRKKEKPEINPINNW